jgi:hypothetical protein
VFDPTAIVKDEPIRSGQYWHVATIAWWMATTGSLPDQYIYLGEVMNDVWIPFDQEQDWLMERRLTGRRVWIQGSEEQAANADFEIKDGWPTGRWRARYGDFWAESAGREPSPREGTWQTPTLGFLAALPRDSSQLLSQLRESSPKRAGDSGAFTYATDVLRSGIVPADLRAALYRALLMIPSVEIASEGGSGSYFSLFIEDDIRRKEILISGENGQFAGERATFTRDVGDYRAGTVQTSTKVATTVVEDVGQT